MNKKYFLQNSFNQPCASIAQKKEEESQKAASGKLQATGLMQKHEGGDDNKNMEQQRRNFYLT